MRISSPRSLCGFPEKMSSWILALKTKLWKQFFGFGHMTTVPLGMSFISEYFLSKALS